MADEQNTVSKTFERLQAESQALDSKGAAPGGTDRRAFPRVHVDMEDLSVEESHWSFVVDLSRDGIAFHSEVEFPEGTEIEISLHGQKKLRVEVVGSELEVDEEHAIAPHRISTKFMDKDAGKRLLEALEIQEAAMELEDL